MSHDCAARIVQAEEAISSAVEEFELQGYDLSQVIKSATGGNTAE